MAMEEGAFVAFGARARRPEFTNWGVPVLTLGSSVTPMLTSEEATGFIK